MKILLDIDGVLVTTPVWKPVESLSDGFMKFNEKAAGNLEKILEATNASIILTTTHRINYSITEWLLLFNARGINPSSISKINEKSSIYEIGSRAAEIDEWFRKQDTFEQFVIIDDDLSINGLPYGIKKKCVLTKPMIGLDDEVKNKVLELLLENN